MTPIKINIYHRSVSTWRLDDSVTWRLKDCVRDWSGILWKQGFGSRDLGTGTGIWERGTGMGIGIVLGSEESDQRYSGKPDGFAGTPKEKKRLRNYIIPES